MQLDADGKLVFEIKNTLPVELTDLTNALSSLAKEYEAFAYSDESNLDGAYRSETRLYVKAMRTGSIISELVPYAPTLLPILSEANTVIGFAKHLKASIEVMLGSKKAAKANVSTPTL